MALEMSERVWGEAYWNEFCTWGGNSRSFGAVSIAKLLSCVLWESAGSWSTSWFLNSSGDLRASIPLHPSEKDGNERVAGEPFLPVPLSLCCRLRRSAWQASNRRACCGFFKGRLMVESRHPRKLRFPISHVGTRSSGFYLGGLSWPLASWKHFSTHLTARRLTCYVLNSFLWLGTSLRNADTSVHVCIWGRAGFYFFHSGSHEITYSWGIWEEQLSLFWVEITTINFCPLGH